MQSILTIPDWRPTRTNEFLAMEHWARSKRKKADYELVQFYARIQRTPPAIHRRLVELEITLTGQQKEADVDAYWKFLLDSLVVSGLLLGDTREDVLLGECYYRRGSRTQTAIILTDIDPACCRSFVSPQPEGESLMAKKPKMPPMPPAKPKAGKKGAKKGGKKC